MREIKFRAWVAKEKVMCDWKELIADHYEFDEFNNEGGLVFLQYTGLKDKNGKEMYEGDIVTFEDGDIRQVVWNKGAGCWDLLPCELHLLYLNLALIEIIGNIWESPRLLEAKQ